MRWRIEVRNKEGVPDSAGDGLKKDIADLGIKGILAIESVSVYILSGGVHSSQIKEISRKLLTDRITQRYVFGNKVLADEENRGRPRFSVEVAYNPGVMDPVEESVRKGILDLGINGVTSVKTGRKYLIRGKISKKDLNLISEKLLYNKVIQHTVTDESSYLIENQPKYHFRKITVSLIESSDRELERISKDGQLFLNLAEMRKVKEYFLSIRRNPTDVELETIAQTWSEHCGHKTFRGLIEYTEERKKEKGKRKNYKSKFKRLKTVLIDNLLKATIMKVTEELKKPWCVSVFKDNAGVIRFDKDYNVCFKVETHNHPSAIEPYGGANTGLGGVIRDSLGTGLGAKPVINTDVFCFARPDYPFGKLPKGILHPKRLMRGVVSGVRDYGNKMGIPTVNGAVLFDGRYLGNPLVYCGSAGLIPKDKSFKEVRTGDFVVLVGGRTGRDGIHGATFSSGELTSESGKVSAQAVQIGNPIEEKKVMDCLLSARDMGLYDAVTDCGGGGLSSAVGEMGQDTGVRVELDKVSLKYEGLTYTEIWISEAQERMILAVPANKLKELLKIFRREDVEAVVIGEFTDTGRLELRYKGNIVCDLDMGFLHNGLPKLPRRARWQARRHKEKAFRCPRDLTVELRKILSDLNVCSKEWIIRQYDHEVQGGSVIKPLVGIDNSGPSDAAVVRPVLNSNRGIIVSNGINPGYGDIDPYWMAASAIDEALRQIIAVGGDLDKIALLDNFCWGDTDNPEQLGGLVRAAYGCYDTAKGYGAPFISGKDSLHNEYIAGNKRVSIPGTLLISAIAVIADVRKAVTMDIKNPGGLIYIVGRTSEELGGSRYYALKGIIGNSVPRVQVKTARKAMEKLSRAIRNGFVSACHDCSDGGLGVAAAEMAFAGGYGAQIYLRKVPYKERKKSKGKSKKEKVKRKNVRDDFIMFSESNSRFIVEVKPDKRRDFEMVMKGVDFGLIGNVRDDRNFIVYGVGGAAVVKSPIEELKEAWQRPLKW